MNRIDVSVIQPNPSKILQTQHEEDNLTKNPDLSLQNQDSIKSPHSFLLGQGSNSRKFTIFKQLQRMKTTKSEQQLNPNKPKIQFKIPAIEDYYIKQSRENIHPNKIHRMESMIYNNNGKREERISQTQQGMPHSSALNVPVDHHTYRNLIIAAGILILITLMLQRKEVFGGSEFSVKLWKFF